MATATNTSPARVIANRRNAQFSTGPRTEEGKARARANAVKHGLTGKGIALPTESVAAVEGLFDALTDELAPQTLIATFLTHQMALAIVRCQRAAKHENITLADRIRRAPLAFDEARTAHAEALLGVIATNPPLARRRLLATPEGVDLLANALIDLRDDLAATPFRWDHRRHERLATLLGLAARDFEGQAACVLSWAILGQWLGLDPAELADLDPAHRDGWAADRLIEQIDAEVDALMTHLNTLDQAEVARDRVRAAEQAEFDPGPDAARVRKYEAAAKRDFFEALRAYPLAEALAPEPAATASVEPPAAVVAAPDPAPVADLPPVAALFVPNSLPGNDLIEPLGSFEPPTPETAATPIATPAAPRTQLRAGQDPRFPTSTADLES